jgi:hypothetical protein
VVEHLLCKHEALNSNPSPTKKTKVLSYDSPVYFFFIICAFGVMFKNPLPDLVVKIHFMFSSMYSIALGLTSDYWSILS